MPDTPFEDEHKDPDEIIEDLESIKDLLDEEQALQNALTENPEALADVPLLDDALEESVTIDEGMKDDTFKALLGDAWQDSVQDLFNDARANIERHRNDWLPEDTDDLAQALKIRIDASVREWLAETLEQNISRLRERIVAELSEELLGQLRGKLNTTPSEDKDPDHG